MTVTLVSPQAADRPEWVRLYRGYADYYGMPMTEQTLDTVWDWIHREDMAFFCRLVKAEDGQPVGLMHYRAMPSPLRGAHIGFLDDLYVAPEHRGSGVVDAMLDALREEARGHGWPFVRWITREQNYRGRAVYDRHAKHTDWQTYQLDT